MKTIVLLFICSGLFISVSAQNQKPIRYKSSNPNAIAPLKVGDQSQEESVIKRKDLNIMATSGRTYNNKALMSMPSRDVNRIAGSVAGVNSRAGETPSIRGVDPSGTAYFVDGIRVYGALPK